MLDGFRLNNTPSLNDNPADYKKLQRKVYLAILLALENFFIEKLCISRKKSRCI